VNATGQSAVFGKRKEPHTVIIAHGDEIRHFTVRPWMTAVIGSAFAAVAIGYLLATSYLVLRDDLIGAATARQARMQQAYEDRISALRSQVDRITSRQLLDQQLMETKVSELLERQTQLSQRHGRLDSVIERAEKEVGAKLPDAALPRSRSRTCAPRSALPPMVGPPPSRWPALAQPTQNRSRCGRPAPTPRRANHQPTVPTSFSWRSTSRCAPSRTSNWIA
jgi:hypothetical protein